jgi:hypothetical protein
MINQKAPAFNNAKNFVEWCKVISQQKDSCSHYFGGVREYYFSSIRSRYYFICEKCKGVR